MAAPDADVVVDVTWPVLPQRAAYAASSAVPVGDDLPPTRPTNAPPPEDVTTYEYLDHTADIQIHSWGADLVASLASAAVAMHGYMVTLVEHAPNLEVDFTAQGHDAQSMVFAFLDESLYHFHARGFVMRHVTVTSVDRDSWTVHAIARGAIYADGCTKGTEVKAITYSNMRIEEHDERTHLYVIVDI